VANCPATDANHRARVSPGNTPVPKIGMKMQFFDSYPCHPLDPDRQTLVLAARRVDAAVAFVTRPAGPFCTIGPPSHGTTHKILVWEIVVQASRLPEKCRRDACTTTKITDGYRVVGTRPCGHTA
jgi:hypothetical protein